MQIYYSPRHCLHAPDSAMVEGHPFISEETPVRAELIRGALTAAGLGQVAAPVDFGLEPLLAVHSADYIQFLKSAWERNASLLGREEPVLPGSVAPRSLRRKPAGFLGQVGYYGFGTGSPILAGTWEAAYWSAQCALNAAAQVLSGSRAAYALCRPPGHHAAADLYGGFCYLNNAAIAARFLADQRPGSRVAVLDIDYHHGNGTQEIFFRDAGVLVCSLHAHPDDDYPYFWGEASETGEGPGLGFNLNVPLPQGIEDEAYLEALAGVLARIREYAPGWLVLSAGLDIAQGDEVGGFCITRQGFERIGRCIQALELPVVIVQEGGYLLEKLGENAAALLSAFACPPAEA